MRNQIRPTQGLCAAVFAVAACNDSLGSEAPLEAPSASTTSEAVIVDGTAFYFVTSNMSCEPAEAAVDALRSRVPANSNVSEARTSCFPGSEFFAFQFSEDGSGPLDSKIAVLATGEVVSLQVSRNLWSSEYRERWGVASWDVAEALESDRMAVGTFEVSRVSGEQLNLALLREVDSAAEVHECGCFALFTTTVGTAVDSLGKDPASSLLAFHVDSGDVGGGESTLP